MSLMIVILAFTLIFMLPLIQGFKVSAGFWQQRNQPSHKPQLTLQVSRLRRQQNYLQLTLVSANGEPLPAARAGQHLQLFGSDADGQPVSRAYSLAQDCRQRRYYRLVIKAESGGRLSPHLFASAKVGDVLLASLPKGRFVVPKQRRPLVLIAGGVGITPMLAMVYQALRQRRAVTLVYQARTAADLMFHRLLSRLPGLRYLPVLSQPAVDWLGGRGRVNAQQLLALGGRRAAYYCCANAAMTTQLSEDFARAGKTLRVERFQAPVSQQAISISYRDISTNAAGSPSVLAALNKAGAAIPYDCLGGSCGLCKKRLLQGDVIQQLEPSVALADNEVLLCCIQAKTPLHIGD